MTNYKGVHAGHPGTHRGCNEQACIDYRARYLKRWQYERSHGLLRLDSTSDTRRHIDILIGLGWSLRSIAGAAGCSPTTIVRIRDGAAKGQKAVLARILDVDPEQVPSHRSNQTREPFVPRIGTNRRLQALLYMGWPHSEISTRAGLQTATLLNQQGRWVTRSNHDKVAKVFAELAMKPGPSARTRGWARRFGYAGPLDWDDIDHDTEPRRVDATAHVDDVAVERRIAGDKTVALNEAEQQLALDRWTTTGRTLAEFERVTGINPHRTKTHIQEAS